MDGEKIKMSNKNTKNVVKTVPKKKKGGVLLYIGIGFLVGALILFFYFGVINTAAEKGTLSIISGENTVVPFSNVIKEVIGGKEEVNKSIEISELQKDIPTITFKDELYLKYEGKTLSDFSFYMYYEDSNGDIKSVYENIYAFDHPKDENGNIIPGEYIARFKFSWGSNDNNYITQEHFFKIIYE